MGKLEVIRNKGEKIFLILPQITEPNEDFKRQYQWYCNHIGEKFTGEIRYCSYAGRKSPNGKENDPCSLCHGYVRPPWMGKAACWGLRGIQTLKLVEEGEQ